jgi:hypothetical protein
VEVKIGVQDSARELVVESASSADEVTAAVSAALSSGGVLTLNDSKGKRVIVPVDKLAYVEIADSGARPLGFGH